MVVELFFIISVEIYFVAKVVSFETLIKGTAISFFDSIPQSFIRDILVNRWINEIFLLTCQLR